MQEEFFDDALLERIDNANDETSEEENKAARNIPKNIQQNRVKKDSLKKSMPDNKLIKSPKKSNDD